MWMNFLLLLNYQNKVVHGQDFVMECSIRNKQTSHIKLTTTTKAKKTVHKGTETTG